MAFSRICKARLQVLPVKLPHKQRLDFFPWRTTPPKHGVWMRSKYFSVTHMRSEFHQNKTEIITGNCNIPPPHIYVLTASDCSLVMIITFRDEEVLWIPLHFHAICLLGWWVGAELLLSSWPVAAVSWRAACPSGWSFRRANFLGDHPCLSEAGQQHAGFESEVFCQSFYYLPLSRD